MMGSSNLDFARSMYEAAARGDWQSLADWLDPQIEFVSVGGPDPGEVSGLPALAREWRQFLSAWEKFRLELQEIRVLDEERVLALFRRTGRGKSSGMEIEDLAGSEGADVLRIRDGKVVTYLTYWERDRALADLGLEA